MTACQPSAIAQIPRDVILLVGSARRPIEPCAVARRWVSFHDVGDLRRDFLWSAGNAVLD